MRAGRGRAGYRRSKAARFPRQSEGPGPSHAPECELEVFFQGRLASRLRLGTFEVERSGPHAGDGRRGKRHAEAEDDPGEPGTSHDDPRPSSMYPWPRTVIRIRG